MDKPDSLVTGAHVIVAVSSGWNKFAAVFARADVRTVGTPTLTTKYVEFLLAMPSVGRVNTQCSLPQDDKQPWIHNYHIIIALAIDRLVPVQAPVPRGISLSSLHLTRPRLTLEPRNGLYPPLSEMPYASSYPEEGLFSVRSGKVPMRPRHAELWQMCDKIDTLRVFARNVANCIE